VKKFNVSEPRYFRGELLNFTEYGQSGTPGDYSRGELLVLFAGKSTHGIRGETPKRKRRASGGYWKCGGSALIFLNLQNIFKFLL
jgi:hypothetical protein